MPKVLKEDGTWAKGKATPKLLREDLRVLPSELVISNDMDIEDADKIHELDPPHIVAALTYEHQKKLAGVDDEAPALDTSDLPGGPLAQIGQRKTLSQREVDWVRVRLLKVLIDNAIAASDSGTEPDMSVRHVWFPENEVNIYELREGNPPPACERPRHLKSLDLWIDPQRPSGGMRDLTCEVGVDLDWDVRGTWDELYRNRHKIEIDKEESGIVWAQ